MDVLFSRGRNHLNIISVYSRHSIICFEPCARLPGTGNISGWAEARANPESITSIHLQSDASPVVGAELQGMIAEVCYQGSPPRIETRVFPGASLPVGFHRFIDKVMSLIWVIFLVAGPREETMRYFLSKVRSVTTDMGLEVNIAAAPDLLPPFLRWMAGEPLTDLYNTVDRLSRLFPRAIRIGGGYPIY